jgi:hypothetical protein
VAIMNMAASSGHVRLVVTVRTVKYDNNYKLTGARRRERVTNSQD